MEVIHINQRQLAACWDMSEATLERWRSEGIGPPYLKLTATVRYRLVDIEAYEASCLLSSTSTRVAGPAELETLRVAHLVKRA